VLSAHPYKPLAFPSLWDETWRDEFTGTAKLADTRQPREH
jgi:galactonate dehydratase